MYSPFFFSLYWQKGRVRSHASLRSVWSVLSFSTLILTLCGTISANAEDVILLNNGDRVSGDIITMEDTVLSIDTDYADVIKIDWDDVKGLIADQPLWISFYDGAKIPDDIGTRDGNRLIIFNLDPEGPIRLDEIQTINLFELTYRGTLNIGGSGTTGNTSTQAINGSGTLTVHQRWHRIILDGQVNRGKAQGELNAQNTSLNTRWDYFLYQFSYVSFINFLEYDKFQDLSLRSTSIIGLGYDILDHRANFLTVSAGPTVVYEDFSAVPSTVTPAFSWQTRWNLEFLSGDMKLWHNHTGTQDIGRDNAVRLTTNQGASFKIYQDLSLRFEYNVQYNSKPADDRKTTDTTIIFGLSLDFLG